MGTPSTRARGLFVSVTFARGRADSITFSRLERDAKGALRDLTSDEIETRLNANGGEHGWLGGPGDATRVVWTTEDNLYLAIYSFQRHELSIRTRGHVER